MELADSSKVREAERKSASGREALGESASLYLRLWGYTGSSQPLKGFLLHEDEEIAQLIDNIISQGKGEVTERRPEILTACFADPVHALATARILQQRFLTFHRKTEPQQVVPSVLISSTKAESAGGTGGVTGAFSVLTNGSSAQILVSEAVHESVKNSPGFQFSPNPVRASGGTGGPDAIHELLWTDESTYGHLRKSTGKTTSTTTKTVGRYQIQEELGRGAMGIVYKAYDQLIGRTVALKTITINRNAPDHDELVERLKQEAKAAGILDHPNIITIYDVGQEGDLVYLSMQFIEGRTLMSVLADGSLPALPTLFSYADQILSAVDFAHACGVIHRDLKPANLMLTTQGVVKILDFGIAKMENATLTQTGLVVGTPSYMAPEQISGKKVDHRADIFALGSVFYELVTREKPFRGDVTTILYKIMHEEPVAPSLINPSLPGGIDAIIRKALAKDPDERFQSCDEMRTAFLEQARQLKVSPAAASPVLPAAIKAAPKPATTSVHYLLDELPGKRKSRSWVGVVAAILLVIIGVIDWAYITKSRTGSFPPAVAKVLGIFHPAPPSQSPSSQSDAKPDASTVLPSGETDSTNSSNAPSGAVASSSGKTNSADGTTAQQAVNTDNASSSGGASVVPQTNAAQTTAAQTTAGQQGSPAASASAPAISDKTQPAADPRSASANTSVPPNAGQPKVNAPSSGSPNQATSSTSGVVATNGDSSKPAQPGSDSSKPAETASADTTTSAPATPVKKAPQPPAVVDGFSRKDVPELLRQAEAASGRGDYRLAKYSYNLILKLEPGNAAARAGLRRVQ